MTGKQRQCIAMLAIGEATHREIFDTLGINGTTLKSWRENPFFMEKVYAHQDRLVDEAVEAQLKKVQTQRPKGSPKLDEELWKKCMADNGFDLFREHFLGRKKVACQSQWGKWFRKEERSLLLCPRSHGKTTTVIDYVVWCICRDRQIRVLILSKSGKNASRWVRSIKAILEGKGKYEKLIHYAGVFKPDNAEKWTQEELIVEGADPAEAHPTISCYGITASIYGLRADLILCDDIVDDKNSQTDEQREKLEDTFFAAIENILDAVDGKKPKMFVIGTRKHPLDLYNTLLSTPGFDCHVQNAVIDWAHARVLAPELFRITYFREKLAKLKIKKFNREFQNAAFDDRDVIVAADAFDDERNLDLARSYGHFQDNWHISICVDPGTSLRVKGTFAAAVIGFDPDQPHKRYLIDWTDEHIPSEDQPRFICHWHHKYKASAIRIETNACQKYLMDAVQREAMVGGNYGGVVWPAFMPNVHPHITNRTKLNDPVAGLETVGHHFEEDQWSLPYGTEKDVAKTQEYIDKLVGYTYREHRKAHHVMCLWFGENEILDRQNRVMNVILLGQPHYRAKERRFAEIRGA
jgi:hypothetical protein